MSRTIAFALTGLVGFFAAIPVAQAKIEAVKGKRYQITKRHGPWMIMVASFRDVPQVKAELQGAGEIRRVRNDRYKDGKSAQEAADDLVFEMRTKGIPAYSYRQKDEIVRTTTLNRKADTTRRVFRAREDRIIVLAGNYSDINDEVAQKTLKFVKRFHPECLDEGAVYRKTPGRPAPLSGAFLTINPLLTQAEIAQIRRDQDPVVRKLNAGVEHSLFDNPGQHTLVVASFYGKTVTDVESRGSRSFQVGDMLDQAGQDAWELCQYMRSFDIQAYVFHDRHRSIVTVGAFETPQDPEIAEVRHFYGRRARQEPFNREVVVEPLTIRIPEDITLPPERIWVMDPVPELISVPQKS